MSEVSGAKAIAALRDDPRQQTRPSRFTATLGQVRIQNELSSRVAVTWFALCGITVRDRSPGLDAAVAARAERLRELYPEPSAAAPVLSSARTLYRRFGIDPSRRRPSSEALLRRVIQGKELYRVNTAVDAANLASLTYFLPVGLYDLDRIVAGDDCVTLRLGLPRETYAGIGKGEIHLEDRPALFDEEGPFGNPSSDSFRTRVTRETRNLLFVVFAPAEQTAEQLAEHRRLSIAILAEHVGGTES